MIKAYRYVPLPVLTMPESSGPHNHLRGHWWLNARGKGVVVGVGKHGQAFPQCNTSKEITERFAEEDQENHPGVTLEVLYVPHAFLPIANDGAMVLPRQAGART